MQTGTFDPQVDAETLYIASRSVGGGEDKIIPILCTRSKVELVEICSVFHKRYGKHLEEWISKSGKCKKLLSALVRPIADYDAGLVKKAVKGLGTDDALLIEVLCTRKNQEIQNMKVAYKSIYRVEMEKDVADDTSFNYKKLLLSILAGNRTDNLAPIDVELVKKDANALYRAGEGRLSRTDDTAFIQILSTRSFVHIQALIEVYQRVVGHKLKDAISSETSGDFKKALWVLAKPQGKFFAKEIHDSVDSGSKKFVRLLNYMSTHRGLMRDVNDYYVKKYKRSLADDIHHHHHEGWFGKAAELVVRSRLS
jgi:hypothetical protein